MNTQELKYQYIDSGLDNVYIKGLKITDDAGEPCVFIPRIGFLHLLIASEIIKQKTFMSGQEVYFLRAELGMSRSILAVRLGITEKDIVRWEKGKWQASNDIETALRNLVHDELIASNIKNSGWSKKIERCKSNQFNSLHINITKSRGGVNPYRVEAA